MLETVVLLFFCLVIGLVSLAVVAWVAFSGRLFYMDGLLLTFVSLTLGGIFLGNFAWSVRDGELRQALNLLRKTSDKSDAPSGPPPA